MFFFDGSHLLLGRDIEGVINESAIWTIVMFR